MAYVATLEEFRLCKAEKTPLYHVEFLPYVGWGTPSKPWGGSEEDVYTERHEAERRFAELVSCGLVERVEFFQLIYPGGGGWARRLLDEWNDGERGEG